jgi:hypothetical protein
MNSKTKSSNFKVVRANRKAFTKNNGPFPSFFSWIIENEIAGMALPTDKEQVRKSTD